MSRPEALSTRELSNLVGDIYDCALDPQRWTQTCKAIAGLCDSGAGGICVHDGGQVLNAPLFVFGHEPGFLQTLAVDYAQSPMALANGLCGIGEVSALSMARFQLPGSRFHREVMQPHAIVDLMWFPALRTGRRVASLHVARRGDAQPFGPRELAVFGLVAPHVCRALSISYATDIGVLKSQMLERTLDGLAAGVFLVARDGHVVSMNAAAERQVRAGTAMRLVDNRLTPVDPVARASLEAAILDAGRGGAGARGRDHAVAIPDTAGGGCVATLLPVADGLRGGVLAPFAAFPASVAVFTQVPVDAPFVPGEAFARLHRLTGGELRVLMALAQGLGGVEAAALLGVGEPTVRTHLQRIYSKTGTSRQGDLLRLLHHSTPPTRHERSSSWSA